jgi:hypothetical protein
VALTIAGAAWFARPKPDPYAFLDAFKPTDLLHPSRQRAGLPLVKPLVYVKQLSFAASDSIAVHGALERNLTPANGFELVRTDSVIKEWRRSDGERVVYFLGPVYEPHTGSIETFALQVQITREETWFDRQLAAVRSFLHL